MQFITESQIDETIAELEQGVEFYDKCLLEFAQQQPGITNYLVDEEFDSLTEDERELMLYLTLIIYRTIDKLTETMPEITMDQLEAAEDANWAVLENVKSFKFQERLDLFFKDTPQEDLLALIEDALSEEDEMLTKEGREPIFVAIKSIVDVLHAEIK